MKEWRVLIFDLCAILSLLAASSPAQEMWRDAHRIPREVPTTVADHPGNIFLAGESVTIKGPPEQGVRWQAVDDANNVVAQGEVSDASAKPGTLGVGWYRLSFLDASGAVVAWTTAGVLARLGAPTPQDSPICVDSATAWFARNDAAKQERLAYLAALAGVNWIRDRMSWGGMQTGPDTFAQNTTYDSAATVQAKHGLKVLQVFHDTPGWATDRTLDGDRASRRFPRDLRHLYNFCKAMGQRYEGRVLAWEPWNEANIAMFGGQTIDEMCTHQKVAYLAFKAARRDLTVCWNVYAGSGTDLHAQGVSENEAGPYFDTYNIHTYSKPDAYLKEFDPARYAAYGLWLTECGIGLHWQTQRPWSELSPEGERQQAQFIAPSYASSLFAGVSRHFFFILGNYPENQNQFGILRDDQTPRPAYVALAAVGRLLAGAVPLGRWIPEQNPEARIYAFRALPDGVEHDILVAWANTPTNIPWPEGISPEAAYDYLGRSITPSLPARLTPSAIFAVLPKGGATRLTLQQPYLVYPPDSKGPTCRIVLQLQMPAAAAILDKQAHVIPADIATDLPLFAYNFSDAKVSGTISVQPPTNCQITPASWAVVLDPMERKVLSARVVVSYTGTINWVRLRGDFGPAGSSVLAFRLTPGVSQEKDKPVTKP